MSIRYTLSLSDGQVFEGSGPDDPLHYLHGADNIPPGLEKSLEGKTAGDRMEVTLAPEEGFGLHRPEAVHTVAREVFPASAKLVPGLVFQGTDEMANPVMGTVTSLHGNSVTIDFNHPLAGKNVHFSVEVAAVRDATPMEQELGRVVEPGC